MPSFCVRCVEREDDEERVSKTIPPCGRPLWMIAGPNDDEDDDGCDDDVETSCP